MSELLHGAASIEPSRIALQDNDRRITYAQLKSLVDAERRWLRQAGERVALFAVNGCGWAIADLALHAERILNVPLPAYFTAQQLHHAVSDAGVDSILTDRPDYVGELWPEFKVASVSKQSGFTLLHRAKSDAQPRTAVPEGTIKVTYTSGSTADPKGVCLSASSLESVARSLANATASLRIQRHLCLMPLPTLLENIGGIYAPLLSGASCIVLPASETGMHYAAIDAHKLLGTIALSQPESLILVPELLRLLVHAASQGWPVPDSLKFIAVGGAAVSQELLEQAQALRLPVYQGYGLSECASVVCLNTPDANRLGSVGKPLPHAQIRVDEKGELLVSGATMNGYLGNPPRAPSDEFHTGDLGDIDSDGFVYIKGRIRNVFITSVGRNISPEWIERELTHETYIRHAIAIGEARPRPVALIQKTRSDIDDSAISRAVSRANCRLPDYARVAAWAPLPEPPTVSNGMLTPNGRLRRETILSRYPMLIDELYETSRMETQA